MADEQQSPSPCSTLRQRRQETAPPPPKKTAATRAAMTTNKEEALRKYLARKGDSLNAAQKQALRTYKEGPRAAHTTKEDRTDKLFVGNLPYKLDDPKVRWGILMRGTMLLAQKSC